MFERRNQPPVSVTLLECVRLIARPVSGEGPRNGGRQWDGGGMTTLVRHCEKGTEAVWSRYGLSV